jgi:hypothetical protein
MKPLHGIKYWKKIGNIFKRMSLEVLREQLREELKKEMLSIIR